MRLLFAKKPACPKPVKTYSDEAERLGVFGAPTYVLNGERFWGQDRLDFLDRALDAIAGHGNPA
jgi:2-hydroxychromene-2-carboxylate isomerase